MKHVLTQLCQQVRDAHASSHPISIRGGNTKSFYGETTQSLSKDGNDSFEKSQGTVVLPASSQHETRILDISPYSGVISYQPSELVITARAGTLLSDIEHVLAGQGQCLAFEPPRFGAGSTLGGCISSGLSGPRRMAAGSVGDFVLGARLLHHSGEVLAFGGEVMKNVAGYDVSRLLAGSLGTLGPIVELSIKVMPLPAYETTHKFEVNEKKALALLDTWRGLPLPISGTGWVATSESHASLYVRLSGSESAVTSALAQMGGEPVPGDISNALWSSLRDQTHPFFQQRPLWRIAVPPTTPELDLGPTLIEWNGGLRWVSTPLPAQELRRRVESHGGHATLYRYDHKPADVSVFHPLTGALERINRRMMAQFDPAGVFNPGKRFPIVEG